MERPATLPPTPPEVATASEALVIALPAAVIAADATTTTSRSLTSAEGAPTAAATAAATATSRPARSSAEASPWSPPRPKASDTFNPTTSLVVGAKEGADVGATLAVGCSEAEGSGVGLGDGTGVCREQSPLPPSLPLPSPPLPLSLLLLALLALLGAPPPLRQGPPQSQSHSTVPPPASKPVALSVRRSVVSLIKSHSLANEGLPTRTAVVPS